jgi:2,5-diketo-D-gluconate reductase B
MANDNTTTQPVVEVRGVAVPALGFGTWQITGDAAEEGVRDALEIGYRQIDTARAYDNETAVGRGLAAAGVPREEIWLTTKVPHQDAAAERVRASAEASLRDLGTDYVDLLLLHWPNPEVPIAETLEAMTALQSEGKVRQFGLSNFPAGMLRAALDVAPVFCDQVEYHPLLGQDRLLGVAEEHDVLITAYSPLAHGKALEEEALRRIGEAHGKSAGQVALRWLLEQPRVSPIPKASSHERRVENFEVLDFELTDEERAEIDALRKDVRTGNPGWAPDWDA